LVEQASVLNIFDISHCSGTNFWIIHELQSNYTIQNMGARHNRKRTRSRPRNRLSSPSQSPRSLSISSAPSDISVDFDSLLPAQQTADHWQSQWMQWQDRLRQQDSMKQQRERTEAMAAEAQRLHIFGGEMGDDVSLCAPMLQVVTGLFGGLDYDDDKV
jgi:hypothetical protein